MVDSDPRHCDGRYDIADEIADAADGLAQRLVRLERSNKSMDFTAMTADVALLYRLLADSQAESRATRAAARVATEVHTVVFRAAAVAGDELLSATIGGSSYSIAGTGVTEDVNLASWFRLYWWTAMSRSGVGADAAAALDLATLTREGRWDDHRRLLFTALRTRDAGDDAWVGHLADAARALEQPVAIFPEEADLLDRGVIDILGAVADGDQALLGDAVISALAGHRRYWTKNAQREADCTGFSSLPIAAAVSIAADSGMTVDVESDYLAMGLIERGWFDAVG